MSYSNGVTILKAFFCDDTENWSLVDNLQVLSYKKASHHNISTCYETKFKGEITPMWIISIWMKKVKQCDVKILFPNCELRPAALPGLVRERFRGEISTRTDVLQWNFKYLEYCQLDRVWSCAFRIFCGFDRICLNLPTFRPWAVIAHLIHQLENVHISSRPAFLLIALLYFRSHSVASTARIFLSVGVVIFREKEVKCLQKDFNKYAHTALFQRCVTEWKTKTMLINLHLPYGLHRAVFEYTCT